MLETKPKKRKASRFFAQELLYDYYTESLDSERKDLVKSALESDLILNEELSHIKKADDYCSALSNTTLSEELKEELLHSRLPRERRLDNVKLRNWPEPAKWVVEALVVSVVVMLIGTTLPWDTFLERTQELADSRPPVSSKPVKTRATFEKKPEVKQQIKKVIKVQPKKEEPTVTMVPAPAPKGQLYRMMMKVYDIEAKTPELRRKLQNLGAKKAGKVELGWRKPDGNYFHFSVPEKSYSELLKTLDGYGRVRIYKSAHPRVMPKGMIRAILFIEDGEPPAEPEQPTQEPEEASPSA